MASPREKKTVIHTLKHYSDIVSDIHQSGSIYGIFILPFYLTFFPAHTLAFYMTFYLAYIPTYFLAYIPTFFLASVLRSGARDWGPAVPMSVEASRFAGDLPVQHGDSLGCLWQKTMRTPNTVNYFELCNLFCGSFWIQTRVETYKLGIPHPSNDHATPSVVFFNDDLTRSTMIFHWIWISQPGHCQPQAANWIRPALLGVSLIRAYQGSERFTESLHQNLRPQTQSVVIHLQL